MVPSPLLRDTDYPSVRAAIDTELDAVGLPDSIIALPIYAGTAEHDILRRDPTALSRTDAGEIQHLHNAAVFYTASYLVLALPRILKETFGTHYQYTKQDLERADLAAALKGRAESEMDDILDPTDLEPEQPTFFSVSQHCRGAW